MEEKHTIGNSQTKELITNGIIAALYVALSVMVAPIATGPIQFRISESLNHLVVFNRKWKWGIITGVLIFNFFWGQGILDVVFGGFQTFLCLMIISQTSHHITNKKVLLGINTLLFTLSMALIAWMIVLTSNTKLAFWPIYASTAISEFATMAISAPIMYFLNKTIHFEQR